jgi:hypothetical protein
VQSDKCWTWERIIANVEVAGTVMMMMCFWREASLSVSEYFENVTESLRPLLC